MIFQAECINPHLVEGTECANEIFGSYFSESLIQCIIFTAVHLVTVADRTTTSRMQTRESKARKTRSCDKGRRVEVMMHLFQGLLKAQSKHN